MKANEILDAIGELFPNARCELKHKTPFQLAVAVVLSAQATDVSVNKVTPALFRAYGTPAKMAQASVKEIETYIKSIGLYHNKAKSIQGLAQGVVQDFHGKMPQTLDELMTLPGIGRKSANVIVSECFGVPAIAVDTHVERIAKRLKLANPSDTVYEVEMKLQRKIPQERWTQAHHQLIFFGRYFCKAQKPQCQDCPFTSFCRDAKKFLPKT